jgi:hypothetical protein
MTATVSIRTADLHRTRLRFESYEGLRRLAAVHGRALVGDYLTGPQLTGDLAGDVVELSWVTEPTGGGEGGEGR